MRFLCSSNIDLYAGSKDGKVIHIIKKDPHKGNKTHSGYLNVGVRKHGQSGLKAYQAHRFIFECFTALSQKGWLWDHINNNKEDNQLCNLKLVTQQQNFKKVAKNRDYKFVAKNHENKKCLKATNCSTGEVSYFNSMVCCSTTSSNKCSYC